MFPVEQQSIKLIVLRAGPRPPGTCGDKPNAAPLYLVICQPLLLLDWKRKKGVEKKCGGDRVEEEHGKPLGRWRWVPSLPFSCLR